jgi:hypothetical protein
LNRVTPRSAEGSGTSSAPQPDVSADLDVTGA